MTIKKCSQCKVKKEITIKTPIYSFCSFDCASKKADEQTSKRIKRENNKVKQVVVEKEKAFNRESKRLKESIKKRTGQKGFYSNLATALHYYIKHILRTGESCYTCEKEQRHEDSGQAFQVGHFIPQKSVDPRRFMLANLRMQCYKCNTHNSGMRAEYRQKLIKEKGIDHVNWLECDVNHKSLKQQYPEISNIKAEIKKYRKLSEGLHKQ